MPALCGGHSHEVGMGVIDFGEASKKIKEARERQSAEVGPIVFNIEVTLYEDSYGIQVAGIDDKEAYHDVASAIVKTGAKMLLSGTPGVEIGDPVAYGFIFDNGPVFTCNYVGRDGVVGERAEWFESRLDELRDGVMFGQERKNDKA